MVPDCKKILPGRIEAYANTIRAPRGSDPRTLSIKWRAIPQLRYYDEASHKPLNLSGKRKERGAVYLDDKVPSLPHPGWQRYGGGIPGRKKNDPESQLVDAYVRWTREPERFKHKLVELPDVWTDLVDPRHWRLFEAKNSVDRRTLREAVGQLPDYKRFFLRKPSIGILLPERPSRGAIAYLEACGVIAVWKTPRGRFGDSTGFRDWSTREV